MVDTHQEIEHGAEQHEAQGKQHHTQGLFAVAAEQVDHPGKQPVARPARHLQPAHDHLAIEEPARDIEQAGVLQVDPQVAVDLLGLLQQVEHLLRLPGLACGDGLALLQHPLVPVHVVQPRAGQLHAQQVGVAQVRAVQVGIAQVGLHQ
ncbi:hypothetical protein D9M71_387610 [compost metagenome]